MESIKGSATRSQGLQQGVEPQCCSHSLLSSVTWACMLESFSPATVRLPSDSQGRWPLAMPGSHSSWSIPAEKTELLLSSLLIAIFRKNLNGLYLGHLPNLLSNHCFPGYRALWLAKAGSLAVAGIAMSHLDSLQERMGCPAVKTVVSW